MVMDCASAELSQVRGERDAGDAHLVHERGRATCASCSAPTSTRCGRRSAPTGASARRSCSRASATAAAASRRTSRRIIKFSADKSYDFKILEGGRGGQRAQKQRAASTKIEAHFGSLKGKTIARLGPGVQAAGPTTCARRRRSRSSRRCSTQGAKVQAYDPEAMRRRARASSATKITYADEELRRAEGRRRAGASSPSGTSSASRTSRGCSKLMRRRSSSTAATSTSPSR